MRTQGLFLWVGLLSFSLLLVFTLGACEILVDELPMCEPGELVAPASLLPGGNEIVDTLTPTLIWNFPADCKPLGFLLEIYSPSIDTWREGYDGYSVVIDNGNARSYTTRPLQPGTMYSWRIMAYPEGPFSYTDTFSTGPQCSEADRDAYLEPILVTPANGATVGTRHTITFSTGDTYDTAQFRMAWHDPNPCIPPEGYTVEISRNANFRREDLMKLQTQTDRTTLDYFFFPLYQWHDCEVFYWRVLIGWPLARDGSDDPYENVYAYSEVWAFIVNTSPFFCPTNLMPEIPEIPIGVPPELVVEEHSSCRSGPGLDYSILDYLENGQSAFIQGRNDDSSWWYILSPNIENHCWVSGGVVALSGDLSQVPVIPVEPPPVPIITDTPAFDCSQYNNNPTACTTTAGNYCRWDASVPPNGACVNR